MSTISHAPPRAAVLPSSELQEAWLRAARDGRSDYNVPVAWTLDGPLDRPALRRALRALTARHEPLRTSLSPHGATQRVLPGDEPPELAEADLRGDPDRECTLPRLLLQAARRPFTLTTPPLWRALLVHLEDERHVLALVFHHAIFDGWSTGVVRRDLERLLAGGGAATLPEMAVQHGDVAAWERTVRDPRAEAFWRRTLAAPPAPLALPADPRWRPVAPFRLLARPFPSVAPADVAALARLAHQRETRLSVVLRAAVIAAVAPYGDGDLVVGLLASNRRRPELQPLIGAVIDYVPLRVGLRRGTTFGGLVAAVRDASTAADAHPLPLGRIRAAAGTGPEERLFDVTINFMPYSRTAPPGPGAGPRWTTHPVPMDQLRPSVTREFPAAARLSHVLRTDAAGALAGDLYANEAAFPGDALDALGRRFARVVTALARSPYRPVADVTAAIDRPA